MSVYVDASMDFGWRLGANCHLFADSLEELHAFARKVGMRREWFQDDARLPHYDLTVPRRAAAVKLGAIEVSRRFVSERMRVAPTQRDP